MKFIEVDTKNCLLGIIILIESFWLLERLTSYSNVNAL